MIGGKAEQIAVAATGAKKAVFTHALINLNSVPVYRSDLLNVNPDVRCTNFLFYVKYKPVVSYKQIHGLKGIPYQRKTDKHYVIVTTFLRRKSLRFRNFHELKGLAENDKEVGFLLKYTNLKEKMLATARQLLDFPIYFTFDYNKYDRMIREQVIKKYYPDDEELNKDYKEFYCTGFTTVEDMIENHERLKKGKGDTE